MNRSLLYIGHNCQSHLAIKKNVRSWEETVQHYCCESQELLQLGHHNRSQITIHALSAISNSSILIELVIRLLNYHHFSFNSSIIHLSNDSLNSLLLRRLLLYAEKWMKRFLYSIILKSNLRVPVSSCSSFSTEAQSSLSSFLSSKIKFWKNKQFSLILWTFSYSYSFNFTASAAALKKAKC
jgi:hypothetical protein